MNLDKVIEEETPRDDLDTEITNTLDHMEDSRHDHHRVTGDGERNTESARQRCKH